MNLKADDAVSLAHEKDTVADGAEHKMKVEKKPKGRTAVASGSFHTRDQVLPGLVWAFRFHPDGVRRRTCRRPTDL